MTRDTTIIERAQHYSTDELLLTTVSLLENLSERIIVIDDQYRKLDREITSHIKEYAMKNQSTDKSLLEMRQDIIHLSPVVLKLRSELDEIRRMVEPIVEDMRLERERQQSLKHKFFDMKIDVLKAFLMKLLPYLAVGLGTYFLMRMGVGLDMVTNLVTNQTQQTEE